MSTTSSLRVNVERLEVAYDLLRDGVASGILPVGLLAVADRSEVIRCGGYGPDGQIGTDGIYLLASITKPIVATAIMQLVERGKLLIDDPVVKHIPEFGVNRKDGVKIWHLLTHTSGLDDGYWGQMKSGATPADDVRGACQTFLRFPPGSRYEYCNVSFTVLGELIARASGMTYPDYLREHVFRPAGMVDTSFRPEPAKSARVQPVHDFADLFGGLEGFISMALPAGGLFSTAADLVAFGQAFLDGGKGRRGRLLAPPTIGLMTRLHTEGLLEYPAGGEPVPAYYGLGWAKTSPRQGTLLSPSGYGHGGATGTHLWIDPQTELVMVFLTNRWGVDGRTKQCIMNAVMAALE